MSRFRLRLPSTTRHTPRRAAPESELTLGGTRGSLGFGRWSGRQARTDIGSGAAARSGRANAVEREIARQAGRLRGLDVYSGLLLSDYPFLCDGIRYTTWHVMPPVRDAVRGGRVGFLPIRGSQVTHLFRSGRLPLDVVVVHVSPPDNAGRCSLGTSVSYPLKTEEPESIRRRAGRRLA